MSKAQDKPQAGSGRPTASRTLSMLMRYKAWANDIAFRSVIAIPAAEAWKERPTTFGNMVHTLNHLYVVDDIFRHHLEGRPHSYRVRNTDATPPLDALRDASRAMDAWYVAKVDGWSEADLAEVVEFEFVGGGHGAMAREEICLHLVNHSTYHRGFVGDMLKQVPYFWEANDLTVFLRDHYRPNAAVADALPVRSASKAAER